MTCDERVDQVGKGCFGIELSESIPRSVNCIVCVLFRMFQYSAEVFGRTRKRLRVLSDHIDCRLPDIIVIIGDNNRGQIAESGRRSDTTERHHIKDSVLGVGIVAQSRSDRARGLRCADQT